MSTLYGLGCDLLDAARVDALLNDHGERFVQRILTDAERSEFERRGGAQSRRGVLYLATRYAAKEALAKAWGTGIGKELSFQDVSVLNDEAGRPVCVPADALKLKLAQRGCEVLVSLSDEQTMVMATVMLVPESDRPRLNHEQPSTRKEEQ